MEFKRYRFKPILGAIVVLVLIAGIVGLLSLGYMDKRMSPPANNANKPSRPTNTMSTANSQAPPMPGEPEREEEYYAHAPNEMNSNSTAVEPQPIQTPNTPFGILMDALKKRLIKDRPEKLTSSQWQNDLWRQMTFASFYPSLYRSRDVIVEVTNGCLSQDNQKLSKQAIGTLRNSITATTKGDACLDAMVEAARHAEILEAP